MVKVIGQGYSWSSTNFSASAFHFKSIESSDVTNEMFDHEKKQKKEPKFWKKSLAKKNSNRINQFVTITRGRYLPSFVVI